MPEFKLHYFGIRGRAEPARLCFAAAGVKYEDIRYTQEDWPQMKKDGFSPVGYLPVLEVKGKKLCESMAIVKYIARESGLAPSDSFDIAICDMIVNMDYDCFQLMVKANILEKDEERKKVLQNEFINTHIPAFLKNINGLLKGNNGGKGYLVGKKLSYADIVIFNTCEMDPLQKVLDDYPELKGHYQRVGEVPGIKAWIQKRPKTAF